MKRKNYKHLFFDLDHTLWDFETNAMHTMQELFIGHALHEKGIENFDDFYSKYSYHNAKLWSRYSKGFIKQDELRWKRMWLALLDYKIADERLARMLSEDFLKALPYKTAVFPYSIEILHYLKNKGYILHLITNGFTSVQHCKIQSCNLNGQFVEVITSECSNSLKPQKEIFDYALKVTGAIASESIMIGDNIEADILGAKNAGWDSVFVNHIRHPELVDATFTVSHLKELEDIF